MSGLDELTGERAWDTVDRYLVDSLVGADPALEGAVERATASGLPKIEVAPNQGKLLHLFARMIGARRVLEFGTLGGYSAIWFGRAVGPHGHVTTFELDEDYARVARENIDRAGLSSRVHVVVGPAIESVQALIDEGAEPFDLVFIDADKPSTPAYLEAALQLVRPGAVIIGDNTIRDGQIANPDSVDDRVQGMQRFIAQLAADPRLDATALQTVGSKGWDGFALALVVDPDAPEVHAA